MLPAAVITFAGFADDGVVDELQRPIIAEPELKDNSVAIGAVA